MILNRADDHILGRKVCTVDKLCLALGDDAAETITLAAPNPAHLLAVAY